MPARRVVQPPVGELVRAIEDHLRRPAPVLVPVRLDPVDVAVDAAGGDDDGLCIDLERLARGLVRAAAAGDTASGGQQFVHAVPVAAGQQVPGGVLEQVAGEGDGQDVAGAPYDVPARDAVARHVQAALHPHRHGHELHLESAQPLVDLGDAALDVGLGPGARPAVLRTDLAEGQPVGEAEFRAIVDAVLALQRRAGEPDAAEALPGESADVLLAVAIEQQDAPPAAEDFIGR